LIFDSGPEGRQNVATPARAWIVIGGTAKPRSGERFSYKSFATLWLNVAKNVHPRLTPWATFCRPSGPKMESHSQLRLPLIPFAHPQPSTFRYPRSDQRYSDDTCLRHTRAA